MSETICMMYVCIVTQVGTNTLTQLKDPVARLEVLEVFPARDKLRLLAFVVAGGHTDDD